MLNRKRAAGATAAALVVTAVVMLLVASARGQSTLAPLPLITTWAWSEGKPKDAFSIAASPDGRFVLSGHWQTSILWDVKDNRGLRALSGHQDNVSHVAFLDEVRAVTVSKKCEVFIWEIPSGRKLASWVADGDDVHNAAVSPDGRRIALGQYDYTLRVWDLATGKLAWSQPKLRGWITGLSYTSDGKLLVTSQQSMVSIWDAATGTAIGHVETREGQVWSVSISPDNHLIAAVDLGTVKIIDIASKKIVATMMPPAAVKAWYEQVVFLRDGTHVAVLHADDDNRMIVGSLRTNQFVAMGAPNEAYGMSVAISPDGRRGYVGRSTGAVQVLDLSSLP